MKIEIRITTIDNKTDTYELKSHNKREDVLLHAIVQEIEFLDEGLTSVEELQGMLGCAYYLDIATEPMAVKENDKICSKEISK